MRCFCSAAPPSPSGGEPTGSNGSSLSATSPSSTAIPTSIYGVDKILAALLLILCLAPVGRAISLDRVRAVRRIKRARLDAVLPPYSGRWAGACTRLMQIQMAVLFFYSGTTKLLGAPMVER